MPWDMLLVAGVLLGVLMLIAILARIWRDRPLCTPESDDKDSRRDGLVQNR